MLALATPACERPAAVCAAVGAVLGVFGTAPTPSGESTRSNALRAADGVAQWVAAASRALFSAASRLAEFPSEAQRLVAFANALATRACVAVINSTAQILRRPTVCNTNHSAFSAFYNCRHCRSDQPTFVSAGATAVFVCRRLGRDAEARALSLTLTALKAPARVEIMAAFGQALPPDASLVVPSWTGFEQPSCNVRQFDVDHADGDTVVTPPPPADVDGAAAWLRDVVGGDGELAEAVAKRAREEEIDGTVLSSMSEDEIGEVLALSDTLEEVANSSALSRALARKRVIGALAASSAATASATASSATGATAAAASSATSAAAAATAAQSPLRATPPSAAAVAAWLRSTRLRFILTDDDCDDDADASGVSDVAPPRPTVGARVQISTACLNRNNLKFLPDSVWWPATVIAVAGADGDAPMEGAEPDAAVSAKVTVRFDNGAGNVTEEFSWPDDDIVLAPSRSATQEHVGARVVGVVTTALESARVDAQLLFALTDANLRALIDATHRMAIADANTPPFDDDDARAARRALCAAVRAARVAAHHSRLPYPRVLPCIEGALRGASPWTGVVIGDTGAGKSTCLNALLGETVLLPTSASTYLKL